MIIHNKIKKWETVDGPKLMKEIGITSRCKILDIGCGFGHYTIAIQSILEGNGKVIALDKNNHVLKDFEARNYLNDNIQYLNNTIENIEKENNFLTEQFTGMIDSPTVIGFRYSFKVRDDRALLCLVRLSFWHVSEPNTEYQQPPKAG